MWKKSDGSVVTLVGSRMEVVKDGEKQIIPFYNVDAKRIGEVLHSQGFRKVA